MYTRKSGWITDITRRSGSAVLGRDRLPTGSFDDPDIDSDQYEGPLWRFGRDESAWDATVGVGDSGGIRLTRADDRSQRAILTSKSRIRMMNRGTLTAVYQSDDESALELLVRWYESTSGSELSSRSERLEATDQWTRIERQLELPPTAEYVRFYFRLYPPDTDSREAKIDNVRLVEWADTTVSGGREYDHLRVNGDATVEFATVAENDGVSWPELDR